MTFRWPAYTKLTVLPGDIPNVQIWTFYVEAFERYCLTERQTRPTFTTLLRGWKQKARGSVRGSALWNEYVAFDRTLPGWPPSIKNSAYAVPLVLTMANLYSVKSWLCPSLSAAGLITSWRPAPRASFSSITKYYRKLNINAVCRLSLAIEVEATRGHVTLWVERDAFSSVALTFSY